MKEKLNKLWETIKVKGLRFGREAGFFLTSSYFLKNILYFFATVTLLLVGTWFWLGFYTDHGESVEVGDYIGMDIESAKKQASSRNIRLTVTDSIYVFGQEGGTIKDQNPQPKALVKENRTIALITYKYTESAKLPRLKGNYDFDRYRRSLSAKDFKLEIGEKVFDPKQAANTILYLLNGDEKITENDIEKGVELPRGTELKAVVTKRNSDFVPVPDLVCKTYDEAEFLVESARLNIAEVVGNIGNPSSTYIVQQSPDSDKMLRIGESVTIYVSNTLPPGCN